MGLDITAYNKIKPMDVVFNADGEPIDPATKEYLGGSWVQIYANPDFSGRELPFKRKAVYAHGDHFGFRAGSYSGYNWWREELAKLAGWPAKFCDYRQSMRHDASVTLESKGPFAELIMFSDCEGFLGTPICQKLLSDFNEFRERADASTDDRWRALYADWHKAFTIAADEGGISFH